MSSQKQILERHSKSIRGVLRLRIVHSKALGIRKPYYVYEPPGLAAMTNVPVLFLFRGHEREWVNIDEDPSRKRTSIEDLDRMFERDELPPMLVVMPGLNSSNNHIPSLGINMVGKDLWRYPGLGTGRYWDFLDSELIPKIDTEYPQTQGAARLAAGFSLGGYTVSLIAAKRPGFLTHAGIFDGLFMWPKHIDNRMPFPEPFCDHIWMKGPLFDAAFGKPRNRTAMNIWNPTDALLNTLPGADSLMRKTSFWISSAPADGDSGNRDRAKFMISVLKKRDFRVGGIPAVLHKDALHTWHWADTFLIQFLRGALNRKADGLPGRIVPQLSRRAR